MKYALLIYTQPGPYESVSEAEGAAIHQEYMALSDEPGCLGGAQLQPVETATTVRFADGETLVTDGPFAETKEALGGYYLIEARDLDEAIDAAARIPGARRGSIEVRPILQLPSGDTAEAIAAAG